MALRYFITEDHLAKLKAAAVAHVELLGLIAEETVSMGDREVLHGLYEDSSPHAHNVKELRGLLDVVETYDRLFDLRHLPQFKDPAA